MKNLVVVSLLLSFMVLLSTAAAQNEATPPALVFTENNTVTLHGDRVNVREAANSKAKVVDNLAIGMQLIIVKQEEKLFTQNELTNYWYRVSYNKDGKKKRRLYLGRVDCSGEPRRRLIYD